ncbi:MAG: 4Fe-4S binding protein [Promethearchaeota archaeon]
MNDIINEKLFPISINPNLCVRCQRCMYSCSTKAIFFKDSLRYVDYNKCEGCLKCVEVCEHGAIEVISIEDGQLKGFEIDSDKCNFCKICINDDFCFKNLYKLQKDKIGKEKIVFQKNNLLECNNCLKCFKNCPNNAIIPVIE